MSNRMKKSALRTMLPRSGVQLFFPIPRIYSFTVSPSYSTQHGQLLMRGTGNMEFPFHLDTVVSAGGTMGNEGDKASFSEASIAVSMGCEE